MSATVHILCGPAGSGHTARLLERYRAAAANLGAALWLGPTHRAVEAVRESLLDGPCLFAPRLFTFQDFAEEIIRANDPAARPLSDVQRRLIAADLVAELHRRKELSHFERVADTHGFTEGIFALLAELKRAEVWPAQLARAAYRRGYRGRHVARTIAGRAISHKDRQCTRLYARYQQQLQRLHLFDLEGRLWYARDLLGRGLRRPFENVRAVFVAGFSDFTRTQMEILLGLCEWVEELWLALPGEEGDERAELFARPRAIVERFAHLAPLIEFSRDPKGSANVAGLAHVARQLFRPLQSIVRSSDADGLLLLEAPGMLGEVRLVAREVKALLLQGTPADEVLLIARELVPYADLVREVFAEYGVPLDVEGAEPLARNPAVAALLRALRVPEDGWPFAAVTALLRSGYFRPDWPETQETPDVAQRAEALLRLLGQSRHREAYLRAVDKWADDPSPAPPDEQAEASRRVRIHNWAVQCRPFLRRFFAAWDAAPGRAPLDRHLDWVRRFADDLGIAPAAAGDERDAAALQCFWDELAAWERLERRRHGAAPTIDRAHFHRLLGTLAAEAGLARAPRGPGRVRFLSAEIARGVSADHVFVLGLGERGFPRLTPAEPIFDEQERQSLKTAGLDVRGVGDRMPDEMLLFYGVVTRARRRLVLSYPAVDEKGQGLLPSSFLAALLDCFEPGAVPVRRKRMLIEGFDRDEPLSPAEYRVHAATALAAGRRLPTGLSRDLAANLRSAALVADHRFRTDEHNPYDGLLRHAGVLAELRERFGGEKVISPTALETYIACPFRFLLEDVLHLEPLEEPGEDVEGSDRGLVFHRTLAWLHRYLKDHGIHGPTADVDRLIREQLDTEVKSHSGHASRAAEALWQIEGRRLQRKAAHYRTDWENFVATWAELKVVPRPLYLEEGFGTTPAEGEEPSPPLVIAGDGIEVRLGGRIDRVDVAQTDAGTFFWIVDYKTGRSSNYSAASLKSFQRLQLTLYALAVERVLLAGQEARPLGLAYWLVTDTGPKVVLPGDRKHHGWFKSADEWAKVSRLLEGLVTDLVKHIRAGDFPLEPRSDTCTETCPYSQVCRIAQGRGVGKKWELPLPTV
ncbi:MAG TPA: PD-(D/E)XK nuclease family protein [Gemmataceae bacterium]|nr:PD-(D/E)XK nuclease family protein [Gemmataceae bacterium]